MLTNSGRISLHVAPIWFSLTKPKMPGVVGISMASALIGAGMASRGNTIPPMNRNGTEVASSTWKARSRSANQAPSAMPRLAMVSAATAANATAPAKLPPRGTSWTQNTKPMK